MNNQGRQKTNEPFFCLPACFLLRAGTCHGGKNMIEFLLEI